MPQARRQRDLEPRLAALGDPRRTPGWPDHEPDYVATLGLGRADAASLLAIAQSSSDPWATEAGGHGRSGPAPTHAWRALAQLGATQAIEPLIERVVTLGLWSDERALREPTEALVLLGPPAINPLTRALWDGRCPEPARICFADALARLARHRPETRDEVVRALTGQLDDLHDSLPRLNGLLVRHLVELQATESWKVIARAFFDDRVDRAITGDPASVRQALGVQEPRRPRRPALPPWLRADGPSPPTPFGGLTHPAGGSRQERRAERKWQRRNRRKRRR